MVVIAALAFALGIALARFYKGSIVVLATLVVESQARRWLELSAGHSVAHALLSVLLSASALQVGFLSGSLFGGLVMGSSKRASTVAPRPK